MRKFLFINPFGIGDALFSMVVVEAIRKNFPDAKIGFLCNERTEALARMNASIDEVFVFNRDEFRRLAKKNILAPFKKLSGFLSEIKKHNFDTTFDFSLGREFAFFSALAGIKERIGFDFKGRGFFLTRKKKIKAYSERHVIDQQLDLVEMLGIRPERGIARLPLKIPPSASKRADGIMARTRINAGDTVIATAPGGGKTWGKNAIYKQWDPENFSQVLNALPNRNFHALVIGDSDEEEILLKTAAAIQSPKTMVSGESIETVSALLSRCSFLLCNDGGLLHLANALGVKTAAIFGPVDERVYGAYGDTAQNLTFAEPVPCRPCYQKFHFPVCSHSRRCLADLSVEKVAAAIKEFA